MSSKLAVFIVTHTQCIQGLNHITLCYLDWRPVSLVFRLDVHCLTLIIWLLLYTSAVCCRKKWILTTTEFHLFNSINWLGIFSVVHRQNHVPWWFLDRTMCPDGSSTEPYALKLTQPLKVSTRDFSWGKGSRCVWLMTYYPCSAKTSRKSGALTYPEPLGPPWPVVGDLYLFNIKCEFFLYNFCL